VGGRAVQCPGGAALQAVAHFLGNVFDVTIIDGGVDGITGLIAWLSAGMRQLQTRYVRNYALIFLLGVAALIGYFVLR
jgi:NADH-quinone oxidoreductase subunit L